MVKSSPPQYSLNSGEISPLLYGRPDYQRNQTGAQKCRGFIPLRQGGVTRAPGTLFRGNTKSDGAARLISFEFAVNDAVVLEFSANLMRVWRYGVLVTSGGPVYELVTPYDAAAVSRLQFIQSADAIYFVDGILPMQKLSRLALDNWTIADAPVTNGPFQGQNLDEAITIQASAETGTAITLTGVGTSFETDHIGGLFSLKITDDTNIATWTGNTAVAVTHRMRYDGRTYEVTAGTNTGVNPPTHTTGEVKVEATGITWLHISDGHGIVKITAVASTLSATADVIKRIPEGCVSSPTYRWSEGAWSDKNGYPRCIEEYDNRLVVANTIVGPRTIWFSTLGTLADFEPTIEADTSFAYTISGDGSQNEIIWLKEGSHGLHIGALGETYSSVSTNDLEAISILNVAFRMDAQIGSKSTPPIAPRGKPIFISRDEQRLIEIDYAFTSNKNEPLELSLPAEHIAAEGLEEIVWQDGPAPVAWIRRSDGDLAPMIYDPREEVLGWATMPVAGEVESLCVTKNASGTRDVVTLIIKRTIDATTRRHVEEIAPVFGLLPASTPLAKAVHLYAAIEFTPGAATDTFTGLGHLEGEEVYAWTDEGEMGPVTVSGASVTLSGAVNSAVIGKSEQGNQSLRTLDIVSADQTGATMGRQKRLKGMGVRLHKTAAAFARSIESDFGDPDRIGRFSDITDASVPSDTTVAYSGIVQAQIPTGVASEVAYEFQPFGGAPMTILGLVPTLDTASR